MKKLLIIMIVAMVTIAFAVSAFAATTIISTATATIGGAAFSPSTNVVISAASTTVAYAATSAHASSRSGPGYQFQITNGINSIYKKVYNNEDVNSWPVRLTAGQEGVMQSGFAQ